MCPKRVTSQDVARLAGVSRTTVSFVLNNAAGMQISEETRQRVREAARVLGYVPDAAAQALASGRSQTIGLLLARRARQIGSDMFLTQILDTLVRVVHHHGMRLLLEVVEDFENREAYLQLVRSNRIDGVLYSGPRSEDVALSVLVEHGVPTVLMGALPGTEYYSVDIDNRISAQQAVAHLVNLGHRRIACITNSPAGYAAARDRLLGYRDALEAGGIPFDDHLVRYGGFDCSSGHEQMDALLELGEKFSAAFVASDVVAIGALAALRAHGLSVPRDVALVAFDDVPIASFLDPPLTTVHLPIAELAEQAARMMVQLVQGYAPPCSQLLLDANLVIRQSCGQYKTE